MGEDRMRIRVLAALVALFAVWVWVDARAQSGGPTVSGAHRFEKVADGVYYATASGTMNVGANSPIIVSGDEALVIDSEITPAAARALEKQGANSLAYLEQVKETTVTPPAVTFDKTMTIVKGGREMRLLYLGRGHTDTDVVVYLPKERIVATGDLMESVVSYMGDSFPDDWIVTLEKLKALDFDTVLPGHGVPFKGKARISAFQDYLRDFITQAKALKAQGLTAEQAAKKIDLTKHSKEFPQIREVGVDEAATRRFYRVAQ